jgi:hypothetical protein
MALQEIFRSSHLFYFFLFNFFLWTYATLFNSFSALYFVNLGYGPAVLGSLAAANALCVLVGHWLFRNLTQVPTMPIYGLLIVLVTAMLVANPVVGASLFLVQAVLIGGLTAVFDREKQLVIPSHARSTIISAFGFSVQIVFIPLSLLFGAIADHSLALAFLTIGGGSLVALAVVALWRRRELPSVHKMKK